MLTTITERRDAIGPTLHKIRYKSGRALIPVDVRALLKSICSACAWPEKIAFGAALTIAVVMIVIWALLVICAGSMHDTRLNDAAIHWFANSEIELIPPLWLVLRALRAAIR